MTTTTTTTNLSTEALLEAERAGRCAEQALMQKAFAVVDPTVKALGIDWKAPISMSGTQAVWDKLCAAHGVTFEDVLKSIPFMTATEAKVERKETTMGVIVFVTAKGYRAGEAW